MAFSAFRKIRVGEGEEIGSKHINAVQDNVSTALAQITGKDALDLTLLPNVVLKAGVVNRVAHKLGRRLAGWWIVRTHGSHPFVYDVQDTNPAPELQLALMSATPVTVDLLVF